MESSRARRIVPTALGLGMLAVIVVAGLSPNTGVVAAASNCTYGQCPSTSTSIPYWEIGTIIAIVVLVLIAALGLTMRRRRRPPAGGVPPGAVQSPPTDTGPVAPMPTPDEHGAPGAAIPPPEYVETEQDVGAALPALGAPPVPPPAPASKTEAEPDIDALMAELDRISGEILKKTPKKPSDPGAGNDSSEPPT